MPQLANLVLTDRAGTPVAHTFVPRDIVEGVATVVESTGVPVGDKRVSLSLRRNGAGNYVAKMTFAFPIVNDQTINGVTTPVVVRTAYCDVEFKFAATSTEQERKDVVGQVYSSLATAATVPNDMLTKLQGIY
jgi:hypothetical protein